MSQELQEVRPVSLLALGALLLCIEGGWTVWAALLPRLSSESVPNAKVEFWFDIGARLLFWVLPSFVYLKARYGSSRFESLGLHFPYGSRQVVRGLLTLGAVTILMLFGTSLNLGTSIPTLLARVSNTSPERFVAPVFEELVFRGVLLSEALLWAAEGAKGAPDLKRRFWIAELTVAAAFVLIHLPSHLARNTLSSWSTPASSLMLTGLVLGLVFAQTRSLYVCILLHWLNNELSLLTIGS